MIKESRVKEIFKDCLFKNEEIINGVPIYKPKKVIGIRTNYGFNPKRLLSYSKEINLILDNMNSEFESGWSFLNLCFDKDNNQWTGNHSSVEELMCLGLAIGRITYCTDNKDLWDILPGGMPYIIIHRREI